MSIRAVTALLFASVVLGRNAAAQDGNRGFWGSIGAGYVALGAGCDSCGTPTYHSGLAIYIRAGGTLKSGVGVGIQVASLTKDDSASMVRLVVTTLVGQWHPYKSAGFYVQSGFGLSSGRQDFNVGGTSTRISRVGIGLTFEVGWDIGIGPMNFTPSAFSQLAALGDVQPRDANGNPYLLKDAIGTGYGIGLSVGLR